MSRTVGTTAIIKRFERLEAQMAAVAAASGVDLTELDARLDTVEASVAAVPTVEEVEAIDTRLTAVEAGAGSANAQVIHMYTADGAAISSGQWSVNPLSIGGETSSVPHNATAAQLKAALEAYPQLVGKVTVTKELDGSNERRWRIVYDESLTLAATTIVTNNIGTDGGAVTIEIT